MRKIAADIIFPIHTQPLTNHVLVLEDDGTVADILPITELDNASIEKVSGALVPGFVNAHCHLELSHQNPEGMPLAKSKKSPFRHIYS